MSSLLGGSSLSLEILDQIPLIPLPNPSESQQIQTALQQGKIQKISAGALWQQDGAIIMLVRRPGWHLCREEAAELASLVPTLQDSKLPTPRLIGIVHETLGVDEFRNKYFKNDIFWDQDKLFYKAIGNNWAGFTSLLKPRVWKNFFRAQAKGYTGNLKGEGRLLGGLLVIGPAKQGILLEYKEKEFGDHAKLDDVVKAVSLIKKA